MLEQIKELPPRARRIPVVIVHYQGASGTTSACAENTLFSIILIILMWNYLRVRGEYAHTANPPDAGWELPPRARRIPWPRNA